MSLIQVSNLSFGYEGNFENIFEQVSFQIDTDWKLGFIGRNGRGKTTFLNLLMGKYEYTGSIRASVSFDYFPFPVEDLSRDTAEIAEQIAPDAEQWELERELSCLGVPEDALLRPFETLSHGERTKVLLAALFLKENNFLLIDEPTNHLDTQARETVSRYLRSKKGFILVSHDRTFLDGCIDHVLSINKTNIEVQKGNFSSWQENKERLDQMERTENERLKKDVKRLNAAARQASGWSDKVEKTKIGTHAADRGAIGHKAAKMMKRAKALEARREQAAAEKSRLLKNVEEEEALSLSVLEYPKNCLLEVENLSVDYGNGPVFDAVRFSVGRGERVVLAGKNGCGKSSIIKLLAGEPVPHTGIVRLDSGLAVSYIPQDTSFLSGSLKDFALQEGIDETLFKTILRKLDFSRTQFEMELSTFSAGQKKKVLIAKSLCQKAHLYVWDEPLNYIDVISRIQIEKVLLESCPAMVFVEHDAAFCRKIATRAVMLS